MTSESPDMPDNENPQDRESENNAPPATGRSGGPDFEAAAKTLNVPVDTLRAAVKPERPGTRPDFEQAAKTLGVDVAALRAALGRNNAPGRGTGGGRPGQRQGSGGGGIRPDFPAAAAKLNTDPETLRGLIKPPAAGERPNFDAAAAALGITTEQVMRAFGLPRNPGQRQRRPAGGQQSGPAGRQQGGGAYNQIRNRPQPAPDFDRASQKLNIPVDQLRAALAVSEGQRQPDFKKAAETLGVNQAELRLIFSRPAQLSRSGANAGGGPQAGRGQQRVFDFAGAAKKLGAQEKELRATLKPANPGDRPRFEAVAEQYGVTVEEVRTALGMRPSKPDAETES